MFKLLFTTAMTAPVLFLAAGNLGGDDTLVSERAVPETSYATLSGTPSPCRSQTLAINFHGPWLETHSAEAVNAAFLDAEDCDIAFVRMTMLNDETGESADYMEARRGEVAAQIAASIGYAAADTLTVRSQVMSRASPDAPDMLLRIERAPSSGGAVLVAGHRVESPPALD